MTSRLKRKLGELGVDTSGRKANENFCLIGTPLPPLEKSRDTGEFVPLWKQDVRDEQGRRRLHGAFTGGFSAGYYNTVGSKEGWTPSNFTSSRNERAKKKEARPEDFMDEEDLQDIKDSRVIVDKTEHMDLTGGTAGGTLGGDDDKDPITRALEASLHAGPKESVGAKILKKMGWRLGQGIGPRVSLKERKAQDARAIQPTTGTRAFGETLDIADDDEEANKHTYPPRDTPVLLVKRKDSYHGLGYVPGMGLNERLGADARDGNESPRLAGGFGLGALNDADEDDLDVYDNSHQQSRRKLAYDHVDGEDNDNVVIGNRSEKKGPVKPSTTTSRQYFHDGHPVPEGFVLDEPVQEERWFPMPQAPPGWKPNPRKVWAQDTNKENQTVPPPPIPQPHEKWKKSTLSAGQRGEALGETPIAAPPRSIFDYVSEKDKERIRRVAAGGTSAAPSQAISLAKLEPHVAQAALHGFQPFPSDPVKQARYTIYLQSQASQDSSAPPLKPAPGQRSDEFHKEIEDYAKAASLFKPISGAMAGRFTSAAIVEHAPTIHEGLHIPTQKELEEKEAQQKQEAEERLGPKAHAAKMGMYGPLTRESRPWQPARLLCKRFGVKEPEGPVEGTSKSAAAGPSFTPSQAEEEIIASTERDESVPTQAADKPRDLEHIGLGEDDTQGQDTLTYQRPSMDIFKAIFASDEEDSDDEDDKDKADADEVGPLPPTDGDSSKTKFTSAATIFDTTPIDPSTFKPTFIPREGKNKSKDREDKARRKEKKEKKKKEKKGVLVSFELDEDADGEDVPKEPEGRPRKKGRLEKPGPKDQGKEVMWVAKTSDPPAEVKVKVDETNTSAEVRPQGRKRAIDFL